MKKPDAQRAEALTEESFAAIARAIADPRRFAILKQVLAAGSLPCAALSEHAVISPPTISHHLKELSEAGLLLVEREGRGARLTVCRPVFEAYIKRLSSL